MHLKLVKSIYYFQIKKNKKIKKKIKKRIKKLINLKIKNLRVSHKLSRNICKVSVMKN